MRGDTGGSTKSCWTHWTGAWRQLFPAAVTNPPGPVVEQGDPDNAPYPLSIPTQDGRSGPSLTTIVTKVVYSRFVELLNGDQPKPNRKTARRLSELVSHLLITHLKRQLLDSIETWWEDRKWVYEEYAGISKKTGVWADLQWINMISHNTRLNNERSPRSCQYVAADEFMNVAHGPEEPWRRILIKLWITNWTSELFSFCFNVRAQKSLIRAEGNVVPTTPPMVENKNKTV